MSWRPIIGAVLLTVAGAAAADEATPAKPALDPEKKVTCVTTQETGSLITRHKSCFTKKQWRYVNDAHNDEARHLADDNRGRLSGN